MTKILTSLSIDETNRLIIIRMISKDQAVKVLEGLNEQLLSLEAPWEYDVIYDLRRHSALADMTEMRTHAEVWQTAIQGRDAGRVTLFVTRDAFFRSRKALYQEHSPRRTVEIFDTLDEALEWLALNRQAVA